MPLMKSNWPDLIIVPLEENRLPARTVLRALEIAGADYEKQASTEDDSSANRVIALWFVLRCR